VEPTDKQIRVIVHGVVVAETRRAKRVLETSHPPTYYLPPEDIRVDCLQASARTSFCEWKGHARYFSIVTEHGECRDAAWAYPDPQPPFRSIRDHLAFYPSRVDACYVDDEQVRAQPGDFYGGWITSNIVGPFKGQQGTAWW
jgi:uncharacterized protein (DUF427 family)